MVARVVDALPEGAEWLYEVKFDGYEQMSEMRWVSPRLVAQIRFVEWTAGNHLRHAAFLGLRDDKRPGDVVRE